MIFNILKCWNLKRLLVSPTERINFCILPKFCQGQAHLLNRLHINLGLIKISRLNVHLPNLKLRGLSNWIYLHIAEVWISGIAVYQNSIICVNISIYGVAVYRISIIHYGKWVGQCIGAAPLFSLNHLAEIQMKLQREKYNWKYISTQI